MSPLNAGQFGRASLLRVALEEAITRGEGEVTATRDDVRGAVHVHGARIAWVHLSSDPDSMHELLPGVAAEEIRRVLERCKRSGSNVLEAAIVARLTTRRELREQLRVVLSRRLHALLTMHEPAVTFLPRRFTYTSDLAYSLEELAGSPQQSHTRMRKVEVDAVARQSVRPRPPSSPRTPAAPTVNPHFTGKLLSAALTIQGVAGASIVNRLTGDVLDSRGAPMSAATVATYARLFPTVDDILPRQLGAGTRSIAFFCPLPIAPHLVLAAVVLRGAVAAGRAEQEITACIRTHTQASIERR